MLDVKYFAAIIIGFCICILVNVTKDGSFWAAVSSAVAASISAFVACQMYQKEKYKEKTENDKELLYAIIQVAALYNKLHSLYLGNDRTDESFNNLKRLDKNSLFDETNRAFYNTNHPDKFNENFIELIVAMAYFKGGVATNNKCLIVDYANVLDNMKYCYEIIVDAYESNGYQNSKILKIVENLLLNEKDIKDAKSEFQEVKLRYDKRNKEAVFIFEWFDKFFLVAIKKVLDMQDELEKHEFLNLEDEVAKIIVSKLMDNAIDLEDEKDEVFNNIPLSKEEEIAKKIISDIRLLYSKKQDDGSIAFVAQTNPS